MKTLNNILRRTFNSKYWHNVGEFCNRKSHPSSVPYRRYRRGKNRCIECGARIGKIKCRRYAFRNEMVDNVYNESALLKWLKRKDFVKGGAK